MKEKYMIPALEIVDLQVEIITSSIELDENETDVMSF